MANYNKTMWINNETVVDAQKLNKLENQMLLMTDSSVTNAKRLEVVEDLVDTKIEDVETRESDDGTIVKFIANGEVKQEILVQGGSSVKIQPDEPLSKDTLWVDVDDENPDAVMADSEILSEFQSKLTEIRNVVDKFDYAITHEFDCGFMIDTEDPDANKPATLSLQARETEEEGDRCGHNPKCELPALLEGPKTPDEDKPSWIDTGDKGNVNIFKLKKGNTKDFSNPKFKGLKDGEPVFCMDTNQIYVGNNGKPMLIGGGGSGSGGGTLTGKFIELSSISTELGNTTAAEESYRLFVDIDGNLKSLPKIADTSITPPKEEASRYKGLIIRHVYGGGNRNIETTICSHGFIELYNNTPLTMNLNGLSVQYATNGEKWSCFPLRGVVKPFHSFLIRCAQHTSLYKPNVKFKIEDFDMHWDIPLSDRSIKVFLGVGVTPIEKTNPFNINDAGMKEPGYIDLFAVGGITEAPNGNISRDFPIDSCEKNYGYIINKHISAERRCNTDASAKQAEFQDTDDNFLDIRGVDLRKALVDTHMPRSSSYGKWTTYYDKIKLDDVPQLLTMGFGQDGNTTRCFNWQTAPSRKGYLKYKKIGTENWITVDSIKKNITHPDTDATVHSVIVRGLTPGKWIYKVGSQGRWSDEYEFEVRNITNADKFTFLQVSDQQSWTEEEYSAWGIVYDEIQKKEKYDFIINPGDISQNGGGKAYEWRYYYDFAPSIPEKCHMSCVGNNDLTYDPEVDKKIDPTAFTWYSTVENSPFISCHSWDLGYCHFICLNSNSWDDNSPLLDEQVAWVIEDLKANKKRWNIVYMHEAPYTQTMSKYLTRFITPFAEGGVDLVMCGHHHRYTRSKRMGALGPNKTNVQSPTGFYTVMSQASGFKLEGKTPNAANNSEYCDVNDNKKIPNYITWDVSYDKIEMKSYHVYNVVPFEENIGKTPEVKVLDTLTITK